MVWPIVIKFGRVVVHIKEPESIWCENFNDLTVSNCSQRPSSELLRFNPFAWDLEWWCVSLLVNNTANPTCLTTEHL